MTDKYTSLREATASVPEGWAMDVVKADDENETVLVGGEVDEEFYPVMTVDTDQYFQPDHALSLARFYAAANPQAIAALLAERDALQDKFDMIVRSVCAALYRHGVTSVDDPGEAIDVLIAGKDKKLKALRALVKEMSENDTYETEYDGRMYSICHGCGAQDGEDHRRPDCLYTRARAALGEKL